MRFAVSGLLAVHGALHVLGFVKAWNLAPVPQLSGRTLVAVSPSGLRVIGLLWLTAAVTLLVAAAMRVANRDPWWTVAAAGVVLSQVLIVWQWQDAWAGTIANLLLAPAIAVAAASGAFEADGTRQAQALLQSAPGPAATLLLPQDIAHLPPPVRGWLQRSGTIGQPRAHTVRLRQGGGLRTAPDQDYMPVSARQYFTVDDPGFVWMVRVTMMRVVPVVGRDTFVRGRGRMHIKAGGLVTVADGTGPAFDQGTALRFLGEIVWFPSAAVAPRITWQPVDERHATATIRLTDVTASAVFEFDDLHRVVRISADRYYDGRTLERWEIPMTAWQSVRGIEIPVRGGAVWKLAAGDFDYFQWQILDVETNPESPFVVDGPASR